MELEAMKRLAKQCADAVNDLTKPHGMTFVLHLVDEGDPAVTRQICVAPGGPDSKLRIVMRWLDSQMVAAETQDGEPH